MIVKDVESTNAMIRQIDTITASSTAKNSIDEDSEINELFDSNTSSNLGFSSLLISVGGNLAISSENLGSMKEILAQDNVKQILEAILDC